VSTATLHAECHVAHCMAYYMATATDVWRLPRGMSFGDCHVAYYMATATWHDAWQLPRGMTYGECFMVQPSSCSAAVRFWRGLVAQFPQLIDYLHGRRSRTGPGRAGSAQPLARLQCVCASAGTAHV
jgi:hypothetical protein